MLNAMPILFITKSKGIASMDSMPVWEARLFNTSFMEMPMVFFQYRFNKLSYFYCFLPYTNSCSLLLIFFAHALE